MSNSKALTDQGFTIDFQLPDNFQIELCDYCEKHGFEVHDIEYLKLERFWKVLSLRNLDPNSCPMDLREFLLESTDPNEQVVPNYYFKLHPDFKYKWEEDAFSQELKQHLTSLTPYFKKLNHVMVLMLKPGFVLPEHRDLLPGNTYDFMKSETSSELGDKRVLFKGEKWFAENFFKYSLAGHKQQNYFSLRVPFSARPGEFGKSYIIVDGQKKYYSPEGKAFVLDDRILHGADPVDFSRGVIFVDGLLDMEKLNQSKINAIVEE